MKKYKYLSLLIIALSLFSSCENVKIEDDYYYIETENIDGMEITLKGNGYGVYGQMLPKYMTGSIKELMQGTPLKIQTSAADDNNPSYNEIFLTFEKNGYIKSFETDISVLKEDGLVQTKVTYIDEDNKEQYLNTKYPLEGEILVDKKVKSITLYIKGYKYYPTTFSSIYYKGDLTSEDYEELKGTQVDNEFTINYVRITDK